MVSLAELYEVPVNNLILLVGPPGSGKTTFCHQVVLNGLAMDRPVMFVTTEQGPVEIIGLLKEKGMGKLLYGMLSFVDAFSETVGMTTPEWPDTVSANCEDLNSISMAIAKLQERIGRKDILLSFDSLTSPYLFNKGEAFRFMRLCLLKFAEEGNSVMALVDEGCGKEEDLVAMMSVADGIIRMDVKENSRIINVVKHPIVTPTKIETSITRSPVIQWGRFDSEVANCIMRTSFTRRSGQPARTEVGDFVNMFWRNLASWSGMLWDPKRFPTMAYELDKEHESMATESVMEHLPWHSKFLLRLSMPKSLSEVKDMKKAISRFLKMGEEMGIGIVEYVVEASKKDEHYLRLYESSSCWGFNNVGARLAFHDCGEWAGFLKALDKVDRDWNVVETKCIGIGSPYCEFKVVPGEIDEQKDFLEATNSFIVEKVHDRMMDQLVGFLAHGKPLAERPRLGSGVSFHEMHHDTSIPAFFSERYRMALRMGGAKTGKEVGQRLMEAEVVGDEAIKRVIDFMEYCKVGIITLGETIRIKENCETFGLQTGESWCFFTTGFLNGFFSTVKNQHVKETRCIAMGDPYCEWEFR